MKPVNYEAIKADFKQKLSDYVNGLIGHISTDDNQLTRYDAPVIMALCEYFDCQVGDLLVYEKTTTE